MYKITKDKLIGLKAPKECVEDFTTLYGDKVSMESEKALIAFLTSMKNWAAFFVYDGALSKDCLVGADFSGLNLDSINFTSLNLPGCTFDGSSMRGVSLTGTNLRGASMVGVDFSGSSLAFADLSNADLIGANFYGVDLGGTKFSGAAS